MAISSATIRVFNEHKRNLIPISFDEPSRLKRPLHTGWSTREYDTEEIKDYVDKGYNLGWRLSPGDVVIDVDPRNDGLAGLKKLLEDFQRHDPDIEDLGDVFPSVRTGGGGWHFYGLIDPQLKIKTTILDYGKGVEFKTTGGQVIIPGSIHPSGNPYSFDDFSPATGPSTPLPDWLVSLIKRDSETIIPSHLASSDAELTPNELKKILDQLPASDYSTNEEWMPLMAASHDATNGAGCEVFVSWSLSDPSFIGHDYLIRNRWNSLTPKTSGNITVNTLYKEVVKHGGQLPPMAHDSFGVQSMNKLSPVAPYVPPAATPEQLSNTVVDKAVKALSVHSLANDIDDVLALVSQVNPLDQDTYIRVISKKTTRSAVVLRKTLAHKIKQAAKNAKNDENDIAANVAASVLTKVFAGGKHLMHGADQQFWEYNGRYWDRIGDNLIKSHLLTEILKHRKDIDSNSLVANLIGQGSQILEASQATRLNLNSATNGHASIVNTQNCEVHIEPNTGLITTQLHSPDSNLTSCLATEFDPSATCPRFTLALKEMFALKSDADEIIRHLWEMIGYIIQPQKNLATWVLFHGSGANGKTVVINVLTELLGKAALTKCIDELDTKRNSHALADLPNKLCVIDEDLDAKTLLPDSVLKKVSEAKYLTANPKMKPSFEFFNTAIILFASNEYPKIKDLSNGMRRRAHVFDFSRVFNESEQDINLTQYIVENELSGVLNEALRGFHRLRQRGGWDVPVGCKQAVNDWVNSSNVVSEFIKEKVIQAKGHKFNFGELYMAYTVWCIENGYTHKITKPNFNKALTALGHTVRRGTGNVMIVENLYVGTVGYNFGGLEQ